MADFPHVAGESRNAQVLRWLVWAAFTGIVVWLGWTTHAADLTSTYLAGRLLWHGDAAALYRPVLHASHTLADPYWAGQVAGTGLNAAYITPYVQTPLWAWLVGPLACATDFPTFKRVFLCLDSAAMLTLVFVAARQWAPRLRPAALQAGLLLGLLVSIPFSNAVMLGQTHVIFLCLAVVAASWAARGRSVAAGGLLAAAAAVKVMPAWLALTWLLQGNRRAAASFAIWFALLSCAAVLCAGWAVYTDYLAVVRGLGSHVVLAFNNDGMAALLLGGDLTHDAAVHFNSLRLPGWIAAVSFLMLGGCAWLGALMNRQSAPQPGGVLTLIAATAFAPLAWNHYFVILVVPVMIFLERWMADGRFRWLAFTAAVCVLNLLPLAATATSPLAVIALRSPLQAALLCILALPFTSGGALPAKSRILEPAGK